MSAPQRDTQLSFVDGMERPVGPLPLSVQTGTNADLIARVAPMYLTGSVLDVTYGEGGWWKKHQPQRFTAHDLHKLDGVDFTALPEADSSIDAVCFDPPYTVSGGKGSTTAGAFLANYGIGQMAGVGDWTSASFYGLILNGLGEVLRVARRFALVKCMEFAQGDGLNGTGFHDVPTVVTNAAVALGWGLHDRIVHHAGPGPGGHNITTIKRARRAHSYLLVFVPAAGRADGTSSRWGSAVAPVPPAEADAGRPSSPSSSVGPPNPPETINRTTATTVPGQGQGGQEPAGLLDPHQDEGSAAVTRRSLHPTREHDTNGAMQ